MAKDSKARLPLGKRAILLGAAAVVALAGLGFWLWQGQEREYELTAFAMGSYVQQTVWGREPEQAAEETVRGIEELEKEISWRRDGDVAQINSQAGGEPVALDKETGTGDLLAEMLELCERSGGALDVTLGPVTRLWDFDNEPKLPDAGELEEALELTGWQDVEMSENHAVRLARQGMSIDLGAVGKGAACDTALEEYRRGGVQAAVIAVGGSVGLYGKKPGGGDWQVGVRDPAGAGSLGVLSLPGGFVSTSGSYEKFFEQDGKVYCHLLDPRTGYPAESGLVSVTVWCPPEMGDKYRCPGALSDGLATACFVLGVEDSLELLGGYGGEAIFIDGDGMVTVTEGLKGRFTLSGAGYRLAEGG